MGSDSFSAILRTRLAVGVVALAGYLGCNTWARQTVDAPSVLPEPALSSPFAPAQSLGGRQLPRQPLQTQGAIRVDVDVVNVFATVRGTHDKIITDLTKNSFIVFEDGREQKLAFFSNDVQQSASLSNAMDIPIAMGLLIDTSSSMTKKLRAEQDAASRFVTEVIGKEDQAIVAGFDTHTNFLSDFTNNVQVLDHAIHATLINAQPPKFVPGPVQPSGGGTNLYDAISRTCQDRLTTVKGHRALVIVTDAVDTGSELTLQDAIVAAQRADTVVHVLFLVDPNFYADDSKGRTVAKRLASETGGRMIDIYNAGDFRKAFDQISLELRSQYYLGYYPSNKAHDGRFRKIKIQVSRPGLRVLARKGYYASLH